MLVQATVIAALITGLNCADVDGSLARVDVARYAGILEDARESVEYLLLCPELDVDGQIDLHLRLAVIYDRIGLHEGSRPVEQALVNVDAANDLRPDASPRSAAGIDYAYAKYWYRAEMSGRRFERAERFARRAIRGFRSLDDNRGLALAVHALGLIHFQRGELAAARTRFEESLELELRDPDPRAELLADYDRHMAFVLVREERLEDALPLYRRSFERRRDAGMRDAAMFAAISYASALVHLERADDAIAPLTYAIEVANSIDSTTGRERVEQVAADMAARPDSRPDSGPGG